MAIIRCPFCNRIFRAPTINASAGGKARAAKLSPEARREQARKAAKARWSKKR